ncbi:NADPH-dependent ferric siderophore reductase [Kineococcus radiotolerans]|uniref:Siderophore-interacting protein n=2 Tax=Kineococcus radiotolerans TaxID=131568 RepID=A6WFH9_KINRD|nr:siderophore-interacting protein [Kineococcus radiotolerans]ABS05568.1 Siderophore-interacting protein [Kineococcus radiotolerans SRS30216 = ATCC BAA-149]MBB2902449.1 NADPH-dependent ferric siderophore reductase [Kineococcus radiotolerans]
MSTDTTAAVGVERETRTELERASYALFPVRVSRVQRVGASFARLTMSSPGLAGFGAGGHDQRIKLLLPQLPLAAHDLPDGDWYAWWRELPDAVRPVMRTYTVRAFRPASARAQAEIDVDFVLHGVEDGHAGPASAWAAAARVGDEVVLVGPSRPGTGRMWGVEWAPPPEARTLLLVGDETALPAVSAVLEQLPPGVRATALLEVPCSGDLTGLSSPADLTVEWLPRNGSHAPGELLLERVREVAPALVDEASRTVAIDFDDVDLDAGILWEVPEHAEAVGPECLYAWLAGEAGVVKALRRHLVREVGVPRSSVAFMGYWREGRAEGQ